MIKPQVGRVVLYWQHGKTQKDAGEKPFAAQIAHVWTDRMINIGYLDSNGNGRNATRVKLIQDGDAIPEFAFCEWPEHSILQAQRQAKREIAEAQG